MARIAIIGLLALLSGSGCACLKVTKVSEEKRVSGKDNHIKGFRYYLSRPYVIVKQPVLVCERSALYAFEGIKPQLTADKKSPAPAEKSIEKMSRINPASGAFEAVTEKELETLRQFIRRDPAVVQAGWKKAPVALVAKPATTAQSAAAADEKSGAAAAQAEVAEANEQLRFAEAPKASGSGPLTVPAVTATDAKTAQLSGNIEIVFLPDMDEQYAVHNCNVLSKSAYSLHFKDGWELTDVGGEFDSTVVPLEILNFIDRAIDAAKSVALAGVNQQARLLSEAAGGDPKSVRKNLHGKDETIVVYQVITSVYLKPGVYRVNKPWEIEGGPGVNGCGLLAKLGLATIETTRIVPAEQMELDLKCPQGCVKPKCP